MVMAQGLFKLLKARDSMMILHVAAPASVLPLCEFMPEIDQAFLLPFQHGEFNLIKRYHFAGALRKEKYDQCIILPNSFKSALIPFLARIPKRTGWRGEWRYGLLNDVRVLNHAKISFHRSSLLMIEQFLALGVSKEEALPHYLNYLPTLAVNSERAKQLAHSLSIDFSKKTVALCPGSSYGSSKRWPEKYFAEIALQQLARGEQICLFGGPAEISLGEKIQELTQHRCFNLINKLDLASSVLLLSQASQVLTNDSGLMHVAAAFNLPIVAVYGSSSPEFTPPLTRKAKIAMLALSCQPCFKRICPLKHHDCMEKLFPDKILPMLESEHDE